MSVVCGGSPVAQKIAELVDAVVVAWYAGEEGGNALADLLFGKVDFTGIKGSSGGVRDFDSGFCTRFMLIRLLFHHRA